MNTRAAVSVRDMHASFLVSATDTPTVVYDKRRVLGTYISFVSAGRCTVYYHAWGCAWYWRFLEVSALEAAAMTGHVFVFVDNDHATGTTIVA